MTHIRTWPRYCLNKHSDQVSSKSRTTDDDGRRTTTDHNSSPWAKNKQKKICRIYPTCCALIPRHIALANCQNISFNLKNDEENVNIRIDCYFCAHMEYKRPGVGLKIYREALARFTEFSNLRLGVYTPYAHKNSNQSLIIGQSSDEVRTWPKVGSL